MFTTQMAAIKNNVELSIKAEETLNLRRKERNVISSFHVILFAYFAQSHFLPAKQNMTNENNK